MRKKVRIILPDGKEVQADSIAAVVMTDSGDTTECSAMLVGCYNDEDLLNSMMMYFEMMDQALSEQQKRNHAVIKNRLSEVMGKFFH